MCNFSKYVVNREEQLYGRACTIRQVSTAVLHKVEEKNLKQNTILNGHVIKRVVIALEEHSRKVTLSFSHHVMWLQYKRKTFLWKFCFIESSDKPPHARAELSFFFSKCFQFVSFLGLQFQICVKFVRASFSSKFSGFLLPLKTHQWVLSSLHYSCLWRSVWMWD